MTDSERLIHIKRHFEYMRVPTPWFWEWSIWMDDYDAMKAQGMNWGAIQNAFVKKGRNQTQAATFIAGMKLIETQGGVQDPSERPSWKEAYTESFVSDIPWGKIVLVGLAYAFVTQGLPNIAGRVVRERSRSRK